MSEDSQAMSDDWRVRVDLHEEGTAHKLTELMEAHDLKHDLEGAFHDRVIVLRDGPEVRCYAGTRSQAEAVERLISSLAAEHDWHLDSELAHWHPFAEDWEDPDKPLPHTDAERIAEHAALIEHEREETARRGYPGWDVRVQCVSHHGASQLSEKLRAEGLPNVRRWRYLLVGAADEDAARELAGRLEREEPEVGHASVEVPARQFAVWGGKGV